MLRLIGIAVAICIGASSASAATLSFTGRTTGSNAATAYIRETPWTGHNTPFGNVNAAGFNMTDNGGPMGSFVAWCLDLTHKLQASADYTVTSTPFSYLSVPTARIQAVFDANYGSVDSTSVVQAAAFQLALWEALYDTDWSLKTNTAGAEFRADGTQILLGFNLFNTAQARAVDATAASYLTAASTYSGGKRWSLTYLESQALPLSQSLVTASPVPVPASVLLLLSSLGGLALWRRRPINRPVNRPA